MPCSRRPGAGGGGVRLRTVWGVWCRFEGLGFRVQGSGFRVRV